MRMILNYFLVLVLCWKLVGCNNSAKGKTCDWVELRCTCHNESEPFDDPLGVQTKVKSLLKCGEKADLYETCGKENCTFLSYKLINSSSDLGDPVGPLMNAILSAFLPIKLRFSSDGHLTNRLFKRMVSETCSVKPMKNAEIKCWKWPELVDCDVTCIPGYVMKIGKENLAEFNTICKMSDNIWIPSKIQECHRYT
ncbi:uncharacterized protein LOC129223795 [Uloborus diversus]|uniref:uncharacterized protein LOC129223795 n=1 Tax=Uloborus diversus TaxID=327109 RepID=UPI002409E525|nr:uncharacterized protein LOC129223795 [Uloborus diversus]